MDLYIFDIDGVLANSDQRIHHIQKDPKDWDSFFDPTEMVADMPISGGVRLCKELQASSAAVAFVTGRPEKTRAATLRWLRYWDLKVTGLDLIMRPDGNRMDDDRLKVRMVEDLAARWKMIPTMIFEDRARVVEAYRDHGWLVAQMAKGDF